MRALQCSVWPCGPRPGRRCADDLADFNAAVEAAEAHNRVAIGYLRTGNTDLASLEIDRLRAAWAKVTAVKRPAVFDGKALYVMTLTEISDRLVAADLMLNSGRPEQARQALTPSAPIFTPCANRPASWCWPIASATPTPPWTR